MMASAARRLLIATILVVAALSGAKAVQPDEIMNDPALEGRARALSQQLRCMVCQNQSIDDSDAPLARDLRVLVRERLAAGDSDASVLDFLVARYGEFVLLKPRFDGRTFLLWLAAPLLLLLGFTALVFRRRSGLSDAPLSAKERERLSQLAQSGATSSHDITKN